MNKFFHKALQHSVGITGLALVYLGIGLVPDFLYNLWTFALSHPLSGGFATGIPLIPLLMSSKQKRRFMYTANRTHTDIDATAQYVANLELEHSLYGWVQKVTYSIASDIPFNQIVTFHGWSYVLDQNGGVGNSDIDNYALTDLSNAQHAATPTINRFPMRPWMATFDPSRTGDTITKHEIYMMDWVEPGDQQQIQIVAQGAADPTAGDLTIRIEVVVIIAAFGAGRSKKQGSSPNFMTIVGNLAGAEGENKFTIVPETDMRLYSIRASMYQLTMDDENFLAIYQGDLDVGDFLTTGTAFNEVYWNKRNMIYLGNNPDHSSDTTTSDQDQFLGITRFMKGAIFMKKSQPWNFHSNNESGNVMYYMITAQVMPDYQNAVDWNINLTPDITVDGWTFYQIPYDIYVTEIAWDYKFTVLNTQTGNTDTEVWIQGIKSGQPNIDSNQYGFLSYPGGSTAQDMRRTGALESIYITAPPADVYGGGTGKTTSYSNSGVTQVNDYYERGSKIGILNTAIATINDLGFMIHIKGVVAKKTGKKDALAEKMHDPEVLDFNTLEAVTI